MPICSLSFKVADNGLRVALVATLIDKLNYKYELLIYDNMSNENETKPLKQPAVSCWVAFDWNKIETHPTEYGKYLICRKDGKIHWETWNGSGWAYNHNEIRYWAVIVPPCS